MPDPDSTFRPYIPPTHLKSIVTLEDKTVYWTTATPEEIKVILDERPNFIALKSWRAGHYSTAVVNISQITKIEVYGQEDHS